MAAPLSAKKEEKCCGVEYAYCGWDRRYDTHTIDVALSTDVQTDFCAQISVNAGAPAQYANIHSTVKIDSTTENKL